MPPYILCKSNLLRVHGVVQGVGDRAAEDAVGVGVDDVEAGGGVAHFDVAVHVHVDVQHERRLVHRLAGLVVDLVQDAGAALDAAAGAAGQGKIHGLVHLAEGALGDILVGHQAQEAGLDQVPPGDVLQLQALAVEGVDVAQTDAVEAGGLVHAEQVGDDAVQPLGEVLPGGIAVGGQGDEAAGEVDLPAAIQGDELVVLHRFLRRVGLGGRTLLLHRVVGIVPADQLLELIGGLVFDLQDRGEAELADHLEQLRLAVAAAFGVGKHAHTSFQVLFL